MQFIITQHQYDIIMRQVLENFPQETGGFLGGQDNKILGVLPCFNQYLYDRTSNFALQSDDIQRAHEFFAKYKLEYLGIYHSHPKGLPEPSAQDIETSIKFKERFIFIIGLEEPTNPVFSVYALTAGRSVTKASFTVIDNKGITVLEINPKKNKGSHLKDGDLLNEAQRLENMLEDIKNERAQYPKMNPLDAFISSSFSTIA